MIRDGQSHMQPGFDEDHVTASLPDHFPTSAANIFTIPRPLSAGKVAIK